MLASSGVDLSVGASSAAIEALHPAKELIESKNARAIPMAGVKFLCCEDRLGHRLLLIGAASAFPTKNCDNMVTKSSFELSIFDSEPYFVSLTPLFRVSLLKMAGLQSSQSSKLDFVTILRNFLQERPCSTLDALQGRWGCARG